MPTKKSPKKKSSPAKKNAPKSPKSPKSRRTLNLEESDDEDPGQPADFK
jgi:hypothetical protein